MEPEEDYVEELPKYSDDELFLLQRFKVSRHSRSITLVARASCCV